VTREANGSLHGAILQFGVFSFGFFEDGDVGIGVFPHGEEILVGGAGFDGIVLHGVGASEVQLCHWNLFACRVPPAKIQNLLKLRRGLIRLLQQQMSFPARIEDPVGSIRRHR
jgi:hypothetical protein